MLERFPDVVRFVHVLVAELGCCAEDGLVEVLEKFCEKRVRRDADADFRAFHVELACDVRVRRENERVWAGNALLDDAECKVAHVGVAGRESDVGNDERHEEFFHGLLEGVKLVDCLGGFRVAADGIAGFGGVEHKTVVFENLGGLLHDACLRVFWMNFDSHIGRFACYLNCFKRFEPKIYKILDGSYWSIVFGQWLLAMVISLWSLTPSMSGATFLSALVKVVKTNAAKNAWDAKRQPRSRHLSYAFAFRAVFGSDM